MPEKSSPPLLQRIARIVSPHTFWSGRDKPESIFFYTFHKCASSLFSGYVLKNLRGLKHIDYAKQIYRLNTGDIIFEKTGFVYGPIRLSADPASPVFKRLVQPASDTDFIRDKIAIFLVRDPRDILVSAYYSFGYTHGISSNLCIQEIQKQRRAKIQGISIDKYAANQSDHIIANFETVEKLSSACDRCIILRYEDMIDNWEVFSSGLTRYTDINPQALKQIYRKSRPRKSEDKTSHRRSGKTAGFRHSLQQDTLMRLSTKFAGILERYNYEM